MTFGSPAPVASQAPTPTPGPWPTFQHDPRHTGRSQYEGPTNVGQRWRYATGASSLNGSPIVGPDGSVYFGAGGHLYSVSGTGSPQWRLPTGDAFGTVLQMPDTLLYVSGLTGSTAEIAQVSPAGAVLAADAFTGAALVAPQSLAVAASGTIYFGVSAATGTTASLYALLPDGSGGMTEQWATPVSLGYLAGSQPAIGADGAIYLGSYASDGRLYAIEPTGTIRWQSETLGFISSSPAIDTDGTILIGSSTGLHAVNPNGRVRWSYRTTTPISYSTPAIDIDGTVYVGVGDALIAVDRVGALRWRIVCLPGGLVNSSAAISAEGGIFFQAIQPGASVSAALCAADANGTLRWAYATQYGGQNGPIVASPAIGLSKTVYVGAPDGVLYTLVNTQYNSALRMRLPLLHR